MKQLTATSLCAGLALAWGVTLYLEHRTVKLLRAAEQAMEEGEWHVLRLRDILGGREPG